MKSAARDVTTTGCEMKKEMELIQDFGDTPTLWEQNTWLLIHKIQASPDLTCVQQTGGLVHAEL